jgi:hypothetical protein
MDSLGSYTMMLHLSEVVNEVTIDLAANQFTAELCRLRVDIRTLNTEGLIELEEYFIWIEHYSTVRDEPILTVGTYDACQAENSLAGESRQRMKGQLLAEHDGPNTFA